MPGTEQEAAQGQTGEWLRGKGASSGASLCKCDEYRDGERLCCGSKTGATGTDPGEVAF